MKVSELFESENSTTILEIIAELLPYSNKRLFEYEEIEGPEGAHLISLHSKKLLGY